MKQSDLITLCKVIDDRGWSPKLIPLYLSGKWSNELQQTVLSKSEVIKAENHLTKIGIYFKEKK